MVSSGIVKIITQWVPYFAVSCIFLTAVVFLFRVNEASINLVKPSVPRIEILGSTSDVLSGTIGRSHGNYLNNQNQNRYQHKIKAMVFSEV